MNTIQNDIIIGSSTGYQPEVISNFVNSLEKTNFQGVLFLIVYPEQLMEYKRFFSHIKNFIIDYKLSNIGRFKSKSKYSFLYRITLLKKLLKVIIDIMVSEKDPNTIIRGLKILGYPHVSRFFEYRDVLINNKNAHNVLLTDVRDVFFQKNPFEKIEIGLHVGMENPIFSIQNEDYNRGWIIDAYGIDFYNTIKNKQISCSGVTIGDYHSICFYVDKMIEEFCKQPYKKMSERIYDQAMHNKLLFCNQFDSVNYCQPFESRIVTLGLYKTSEILTNKIGLIIDKYENIIPIIHQHDRHPAILENFIKYLGE